MNALTAVATPASVLDLQVQALLKRVTLYRDQKCAQLRAAAERDTREMLKGARAEARARLREAVRRERSRLEQGERQAQARTELEARQREQAQSQALLARMWDEVEPVLKRRWQDQTQRSAWIEEAMRQAGGLLSGRAWTLECAELLEQRERERLAAAAQRHGAVSLGFLRDEAIRAGLRLRAPGVLLDATASGLLSSRSFVESAFLAEYAHE